MSIHVPSRRITCKPPTPSSVSSVTAAAAADEGADVFAACGEGPVLGQIELAQERGLLATGYVGDMSSLGPRHGDRLDGAGTPPSCSGR